MQLNISFSTLLTGVLLALSAGEANAAPTASKRSAGITLPLKRVAQRTDVHPQIMLQQNINRSLRRHARMTGRAEPSQHDLEENLRKRVLAIEGPEGLAKRYNRAGTNFKHGKRFNRGGVARVNSFHQEHENANVVGDDTPAAGAGHGNGHGNAQAGGNAAGNANSNSTDTTGATGGNSTDTTGAAGGNSTDTTGATGASGNGTAAAANGVTTAGAPTADNSLGLDIEATDVGYQATIQFGTPPQDLAILMDSGSADLWVGAEGCDTFDQATQTAQNTGCGNHKFLGTKSSSSFVDSGKEFQVTYGTGAVVGTIVNDDISVAGLALKGHTFGVAAFETNDFSSDDTPFDGLMGLAKSTLSEQQTLTPPEALAKAGLITDAIVSYKISRLADNKNDGEITFGALDQTKFDANTLETLANVNKQGFWESDMAAVSVDGKDLGLQGRTAILDTGTTLIVAPTADAEAIHNAIDGAVTDGQGGFAVPCDTKASVALTFGKTEFAIDPRDLAFAPLNDGSGLCISGITAGQIGGANEWLVGDVFLKNAYFSTDVTKDTLSLAKLV
jgi:hypothetical protein